MNENVTVIKDFARNVFRENDEKYQNNEWLGTKLKAKTTNVVKDIVIILRLTPTRYGMI